MTKLMAFNYFGSKYTHLEFVLQHLPDAHTFVDVFGGSGVVILNKRPSVIEAYNDVSSTVVNFFRVLRSMPDELIMQIMLTPYAKEEYLYCYRSMNEGSDLERARKFFVVINQSFNGTFSRQTGWKMSTIVNNSAISESVSRWVRRVPNLVNIIDRLREIQILNHDYRSVLRKFDSDRTLFYCDPPYLHTERTNSNEYEHEMNLQDHEEFLNHCKKLKGKVLISGYESDLYNSELKEFNKVCGKKKTVGFFQSNKPEVLWMNYDVAEGMPLFNGDVA